MPEKALAAVIQEVYIHMVSYPRSTQFVFGDGGLPACLQAARSLKLCGEIADQAGFLLPTTAHSDL